MDGDGFDVDDRADDLEGHVLGRPAEIGGLYKRK